MIVSKKGCVAALKEAWKKGYEIVPYGERISIFTENWSLETTTRELPLEVAQILVEHFGGIPTEPMLVQKGRDGQMALPGRWDELQELQEGADYIHKVPVTYKDKWQMFVTAEGDWMCLDLAYLAILEEQCACTILRTSSGMAIFSLQEERLTVAPGNFGREDQRKLDQIAQMFREQRIQEVEIPENVCLFDDLNSDEE